MTYDEGDDSHDIRAENVTSRNDEEWFYRLSLAGKCWPIPSPCILIFLFLQKISKWNGDDDEGDDSDDIGAKSWQAGMNDDEGDDGNDIGAELWYRRWWWQRVVSGVEERWQLEATKV